MSQRHGDLAPAVPAGRPSEQGAALIFALFGLCTLTILGLGLTSLGMMATRMTSNERDTQQALGLADAGLAHARKLITYQEWDWPTMTPFLNGGDGNGCTGDELSQAPAGAPVGYPTLFITSAAAGGQPIGTGTYRVYVCDDDLTDVDPTTGVLNVDQNADVNKRILVRSVGTTANGATATVEHVFSPSSAPAILVNGNLKVRGDVNVMGSGGIIHSNGTTDIVGNSTCAQQYFSATQQITGGIPEGGAGCNQPGELRPGSAPINIRNMDASSYRQLAEYMLTTEIVGGNTQEVIYRNWNYPAAAANDLVTPVAGAVVAGAAWVRCNATPVDARCTTWPARWTFNRSNFEWRSNGDIKTTVYYATTHVNFGGNINTSTAIDTAGNHVATVPPLQTPGLTILAQGSILVGGGATILGKLVVSSVGPIAFLSNQDLNMDGTSGGGGANWNGLLYARHQIEISGSPQVNGQVVALNAADTDFPVAWPTGGVNPSNPVRLQGGYMTISGTPNITYAGNGMMSTLPQAWRECRQDPANVNPLPGRIDDACGRLYGGT
jgi:hypothetical protein